MNTNIGDIYTKIMNGLFSAYSAVKRGLAEKSVIPEADEIGQCMGI